MHNRNASTRAASRQRRDGVLGSLAAMLVACTGACSPGTNEPAAAPLESSESAWSSFVSRQSVKNAFDRQAGIDNSDPTVTDCADVHAVMSCSFTAGAFVREVPDEARALATVEVMPDELLEITGLDSATVSNIDLHGDGSTPARRFHYLGQFKTLIRVLAPDIGEPELDRLVDELKLGTTPQTQLRTAASRPFADIVCAQGGGASAYIQCQTEPARK